jgi:chemotaxis regulatin CheY-phosphate phosphatase CheZ
VCRAEFEKCKKEKFQLAQALRDSQGKLHATVQDKIVAMEESLVSVKNRKDCEGQVMDLMKKLRDTKQELVDKNIRLKEANEEIISLREQLMEIPDSMYIADY